MKHLLSVSIKFYQNNGLLGICSRKIGQLRGGADDYGRIPHTEEFSKHSSSTPKTSLTAQQIDQILDDDQIAEAQKKPLRDLREDQMFDDSERLKMKRLRDNLVGRTKHPFYSKVKGKLPYAILSPFTFAELARLGIYRLAGYTSAPFTIPAIIGFSMPCAVTFSMLEMYAPDKFKFPCKCAKWTGGIIFYGVCSGVDYVTSGIETKIFGQPLPIDAPQLMGTLPQRGDLDELRKLKALADSIMEKSNPQATLDGLDGLDILGED